MESERGNVEGDGRNTRGELPPSGRGPVYAATPQEDGGEGTQGNPKQFVEYLTIDELEANIIDASHYCSLDVVIRYVHRLGNLCEYYRDERNKLEEMYERCVRVALTADPIPAMEREDDQLEPPWMVFERVVQERDTLVAWSKLLKD